MQHYYKLRSRRWKNFLYNPEKARQMLADAGVPVGFKMELIFPSASIRETDEAAMLKEMWAKIGIDVNLIGMADAAFFALAQYPGEYKHARTGGDANCNPIFETARAGGAGNFSRWVDEYFLEQHEVALAEMDVIKRNAIMKDLAVYILEQVPSVPLGCPYTLHAYWPWIKNYYNEFLCGVNDHVEVQSTLWIDQTLKAELGY